ncbi:sporulation delaying protein family toxin [Streptomyces violascens]|uniref:sporulation delaying protein family toxin n=1 Tax=Streptomyces violascens TaxID=67381 RepID=UPI0037B46CAC
MNLKKTGALACAAAVLTVGIAYGSASAAPVAVHAAVKPAEHHVKYSDEDIVGLLVFAKGKAADEHPDLAKQIRSRRSPQTSQVTLEQIAVFTKDLKVVDKDFHDKVTVAVQINDPFQAKAGMERLNEDLKSFMTQHKTPAMKSPNRANGWFWHDAYIVIEINAVGAINAIGYANVAGATEAVVTLVVVPAAVSYGFDMSQPNNLDADNMVSSVAAAL